MTLTTCREPQVSSGSPEPLLSPLIPPPSPSALPSSPCLLQPAGSFIPQGTGPGLDCQACAITSLLEAFS